MTERVGYLESPGLWLRRQREAAGITLEGLARRSGLSVRAISDLERDRTRKPHPRSVRLIAGSLGLSETAANELIARYRTGLNGGGARAEPNATRAAGPADSFGPLPGRGMSGRTDVQSAPTAGQAVETGQGLMVVPRQLPAAVAHFVGRAAELETLDRAAKDEPGAPVVLLISGPPGVGKTALAIHWAHRAAGQFPDGQLHVNLRGFGPAVEPVSPAGVVRGFLGALGVPAQRIPGTAEEQFGLYRSLLAGMRVLVVADNAMDEDQVRPLLPANPGCLVVVTSRTQLGGLVAAEGAHQLTLDVLTESEARELLDGRLGTGRAAAEPRAIAELISLCGRQPLALAVTAARAVAHPGFSLMALVAELRDANERLDTLAAGDEATSVKTIFSWSYQRLSCSAARMFRLLGLHPGPDISVPAAASLAAVSIVEAQDLLRELVRANLVTEHAPGRLDFHDLLRSYAAQQAEAHDSTQQRQDALTRLFDYYLAAVGAVTDTLLPGTRHRRPSEGKLPTRLPSAGTPEAAHSWLDQERANLVAVARYTATHGWPGHAIRLSALLSDYLGLGGHYADSLVMHAQALRAARQIGDRPAQADALRWRSEVDFRRGRYESAARQLRLALAIYGELGDRFGLARTLGNLGLVLWRQGSYREAIRRYTHSLALSRDSGDKYGQILALDHLCLVLCRLGRYQQAEDHARQALAIHAEFGDPAAEAGTLDDLGVALCGQRRFHEAAECHRQAMARLRDLHRRQTEAENNLAAVLYGQGQYQQAADHRLRVLATFREMGVRSGEAEALNGLGEALNALGQRAQARAHHYEALTLATGMVDRYEQARAHDGLARTYQAADEIVPARYHWKVAFSLYRNIGVPDAERARAGLDSLELASRDANARQACERRSAMVANVRFGSSGECFDAPGAADPSGDLSGGGLTSGEAGDGSAGLSDHFFVPLRPSAANDLDGLGGAAGR